MTEHAAYPVAVLPVGTFLPANLADLSALVAEVDPAPNQTIVIPAVAGVVSGCYRLFTHLDVWSLPVGDYLVVRRSVTGTVQYRTVTGSPGGEL